MAIFKADVKRELSDYDWHDASRHRVLISLIDDGLPSHLSFGDPRPSEEDDWDVFTHACRDCKDVIFNALSVKMRACDITDENGHRYVMLVQPLGTSFTRVVDGRSAREFDVPTSGIQVTYGERIEDGYLTQVTRWDVSDLEAILGCELAGIYPQDV